MTKEVISMERALKLALEALEANVIGTSGRMPKTHEAITALREALAEQPAQQDMPKIGCVNHDCDQCKAQPQQEPVAWATRMGEYAHIHWGAKRPEYPVRYEVPLYTSPPAQRTWVGLTKTVVGNYLRLHALGDQPTFRQGFKEGAAFAEAKLKEKNT